jgi:hypothetical protein
MHLLAERTILGGLKEGGLLTGDLDDMMESRLGAIFMPHGRPHEAAGCSALPAFCVAGGLPLRSCGGGAWTGDMHLTSGQSSE